MVSVHAGGSSTQRWRSTARHMSVGSECSKSIANASATCQRPGVPSPAHQSARRQVALALSPTMSTRFVDVLHALDTMLRFARERGVDAAAVEAAAVAVVAAIDEDASPSPSRIACESGLPDLLSFLIDHDLQRERNPLALACGKGQKACAALLLDRGFCVNGAKGALTTGRGVPLRAACARGHADCAALLLDRGARANIVDERGNTPLHDASSSFHSNCVKVLLDHGADVDPVNRRGATPLIRAWGSTEGALECARLLLNHGADVNAHTVAGMTALCLASGVGATEFVALLLEHRAQIDYVPAARGSTVKTPLWSACWGGHDGTAALLLQRGAAIPREPVPGPLRCVALCRAALARRRWRAARTWIGLVGWLRARAAERAYAPGGAGFEDCKRRRIAGGMAP